MIPAHPFPQLLNKSLNLIVRLELRKNGETLKHMAVVQLPAILPRLVQLPRKDGRRDYVYLGDLIGHFLADLFPGHDDSRLVAVPRYAQQRAVH